MTDDALVQIETDRLLLTLPPPSAAARVVRYFADNREHLSAGDPPRPSEFYTGDHWCERLRKNRQELAEDRTLRLFVFERDALDGPVIGACNFTQIVRGPFQCCSLGYNLDHRRQGQGLMTESLRAALTYVFDELGLHRVQANYVPTNERSARVLQRLGFAVEGYARRYLYIAGEWRDHVLSSLTNPNPQIPNV